VTDPLTRVVAVSAPFRFASNGCQVAGYAFPATAVAIVIVEWIRLGGGISELFDATFMPGVRCPMSLGPDSTEIQSTITLDV